MTTAGRLLSVVGIVALLGFAAFEAVRYGVAGMAAESAIRALLRPAQPGVSLADTWWHRDVVRTARELPDDPTLRELQALVILRSSRNAEDLLAAQRELAAAIQARPGSGYTWASLAEVKYRLGETGPGFENALANAIALAPYEPEVQRTVADFGLAVIDEVQPSTQAAIERAVVAGMKRNAPEMLQIATRRGRLGVACRHLDGVPRPTASKWTQLCQSMEATS